MKDEEWRGSEDEKTNKWTDICDCRVAFLNKLKLKCSNYRGQIVQKTQNVNFDFRFSPKQIH